MNGQAAMTIRIPLPGGSTAELLGATGSNTHLLHSDWLGSARISADWDRQLVYDTAYAPYGESYDGTSNDQNFTGQSQDTLSGLYDFLYREHSPVRGRWISPDPSGMAAVDPSNPQSWNRYAYVMNDPLSYTDPIGLDYCADVNGNAVPDDQGGDNNVNCTKVDGAWMVQVAPSNVVNVAGQQGTLLQFLTTTVPIYVPNDVPLNPTAQLYITAIAKAAPTVCGGGAFVFAGREVSGGPVHAFAGAITTFDSQGGTTTGALFEAGGGEGLEGGGGREVVPNGSGSLGSEDLLFGGFGVNTPIASASAGVVGFTSGAGLYAQGSLFGRAAGGGIYANVTTNGGCQKK
jgi:RHS repeat-associated protein